jgi:hypothetical protein
MIRRRAERRRGGTGARGAGAARSLHALEGDRQVVARPVGPGAVADDPIEHRGVDLDLAKHRCEGAADGLHVDVGRARVLGRTMFASASGRRSPLTWVCGPRRLPARGAPPGEPHRCLSRLRGWHRVRDRNPMHTSMAGAHDRPRPPGDPSVRPQTRAGGGGSRARRASRAFRRPACSDPSRRRASQGRGLRSRSPLERCPILLVLSGCRRIVRRPFRRSPRATIRHFPRVVSAPCSEGFRAALMAPVTEAMAEPYQTGSRLTDG